MYKNDPANLTAMLEAAGKILEYVKPLGSAEDYYNSSMVFDATLMNFITIGEMVDRLSDSLKNSHPDMDWKKIKDFRNLVAHDYLGIDAEEVWQIISNDVPALEEKLRTVLSSLS